MTQEILILEHQADASAAELQTWLEEQGETYVTLNPQHELPQPGQYSRIVCLGSEESAYDTSTSWIAAEQEFLRESMARGSRVFGICFGAQQLAMITGGNVTEMKTPELGWITVEGTALLRGSWFAWHEDHITPGQDVRVFASSQSSVQVFTADDRHLAVQFHPEIGPERIREWLNSEGRLQALKEAGQNPDQVLEQTESFAAETLESAGHLYRAFFDDELHKLDHN